MKKLLTWIMLACIAVVPAFSEGEQARPNRSERAMRARAERKAKLEAMTPEERKRFRRKEAERSVANRQIERARHAKETADKFRAAKAACGPDCYRVIVTNGVFVGMTRLQYDAYLAAEAERNKIVPRKVSPQRKANLKKRHNPRNKKRLHGYEPPSGSKM